MSISRNIDEGKNLSVVIPENATSFSITLVRGGPIDVVTVFRKGKNRTTVIMATGKAVEEPVAGASNVVIKATHNCRVSYMITAPTPGQEKK